MKKAIIITLAIGLLAYGVYAYVSVQTKLLQNFTYQIIGFQLQNISKGQLSFSVTIRFTNASNIEAQVQSLYTDVFLDDKNVGYITEAKQFVIPAKGSSDVVLYFSFQPQDVLTNAIDLILGATSSSQLNLSIKGTAKISSSFITTTIPIDYAKQISV